MPDIGFIWLYIVITFQINNDKHCSALGSPIPMSYGSQPIGSWQAADDRLSRADARQLLSVASDVPDADAVPWRMRGTAGDSGVTDGNMLTKNDQNIQTWEGMRCLIEQIMKGWTILSKTRHKTIEIWWARAKQSSYLWKLCGLNKKWGLQNRSGDRTNRNRDTQQQIMVNTCKYN